MAMQSGTARWWVWFGCVWVVSVSVTIVIWHGWSSRPVVIESQSVATLGEPVEPGYLRYRQGPYRSQKPPIPDAEVVPDVAVERDSGGTFTPERFPPYNDQAVGRAFMGLPVFAIRSTQPTTIAGTDGDLTALWASANGALNVRVVDESGRGVHFAEQAHNDHDLNWLLLLGGYAVFAQVVTAVGVGVAMRTRRP